MALACPGAAFAACGSRSSLTVMASAEGGAAAGSPRGGAGGATSASTSANSTASGAPCAATPTFAAKAAMQFGSLWVYDAQVGLTAGNQACMDVGADHVCDYDDIVLAASKGELAALAPTDTAWLQRTHDVTVSATSPRIVVLGHPAVVGTTYKVSKASRCIDWTYAGEYLNDGEFVAFESGGNAPTFHLDDDPCAIQPSPKDIPCGHDALLRSVLCCYAKCTPGPPDTTCTCDSGVCYE